MSEIEERETLARKRYFILNTVRIGALAAVILGIAIARAVVDLPYALGVVLAVVGLLAFFFAPRTLARRWKSDAGDDNP
ncbi:hypothetical protein [Erythrobacter ani]|uniref:DUF202 domain-containing protein n=1 Tax=Erythrobacter ani TaxID=2827235 RepID=A0ABS6SIW7_9SPHN|nr:hypothetical protein [Erythrobacter ani]MBV7264943.1 hypothetical protein [Erythrobacter ani]